MEPYFDAREFARDAMWRYDGAETVSSIREN